MWRSKSRPQVAQIQMMSDPHAPDIWRVNAQLPNINEFYKAYDIKKRFTYVGFQKQQT
ncbi:M13-type metalloendopeptidase [Apilactobacillus ozensis]|uniref:M13-type metalloendopeptidase n=1 Tax=Apilactobacillus ozensis TaxID=866801 RepID=UPI00209391A1|nr:M13-type metalloendopeptidase [Apilactobacillus ozensis]